MALMPKDVSAKIDSYNMLGDDPAIGLFNWPGTGGKAIGITCPSLSGAAGQLIRAPHDPHQLLCLGEFVRLNGLDGFELDQRPPADELGGAPSQFPGTGFSRQEFYKQIIADPKAPADDRAYALYRAVNCYGPSGINGCGGADVPIGQRKEWFKTLKSTYASTPWAADLKYFW